MAGVALVGGEVVRTGVGVAGVGEADVGVADVGEVVVGAVVVFGRVGIVLADRRTLTATGPDELQAVKRKRGNATAAIAELRR